MTRVPVVVAYSKKKTLGSAGMQISTGTRLQTKDLVLTMALHCFTGAPRQRNCGRYDNRKGTVDTYKFQRERAQHPTCKVPPPPGALTRKKRY